MKTLYININGEAIKSDNNIEVIGSVEDSIVESFYISLGEAIAGGVTGIKYKPLVADFANVKPNEFKSFSDQWQEVKALLLGDNPSGDYEFTLSSEYLDWLKMNATYSTIYYKKYQNQHQAKVKLNLDELYEDTVDAIRRKVIRFLQTDDNFKNYEEFVVNDYAVTRRSLLVRSVKSKFEEIAFVLYEKWEKSQDVCPYCGKNPCECKLEPPVCPKCGKNPCECKSEKKWSTAEDIRNGNIILEGIILNKTLLKELSAKGISFHLWNREFPYLQEADINDYLSVYIPYCRYRDLEEVKSRYAENIFNLEDDYFLNENKIVKSMTIKCTFNNLEQLDIPFFREMGWTADYDGFDYEHFIETLEEFGYTKIENPYHSNDDSDDTEFFISNKVNSKEWIIIEVTITDYDDDYQLNITFGACPFNNLVSYHTGKILSKNT